MVSSPSDLKGMLNVYFLRGEASQLGFDMGLVSCGSPDLGSVEQHLAVLKAERCCSRKQGLEPPRAWCSLWAHTPWSLAGHWQQPTDEWYGCVGSRGCCHPEDPSFLGTHGPECPGWHHHCQNRGRDAGHHHAPSHCEGGLLTSYGECPLELVLSPQPWGRGFLDIVIRQWSLLLASGPTIEDGGPWLVLGGGWGISWQPWGCGCLVARPVAQ